MKTVRSEKQQNKTLSKRTNVPKKTGSPFEIVMETIQQLPNERMQTVLLKRFGLNDSELETLEMIGKGLGVTRERIRQIEAKALRKLRHPSRSKRLKDYLE